MTQTLIDVDDDLLIRARVILGPTATKKDAVNTALSKLVRPHEQRDAIDWIVAADPAADLRDPEIRAVGGRAWMTRLLHLMPQQLAHSRTVRDRLRRTGAQLDCPVAEEIPQRPQVDLHFVEGKTCVAAPGQAAEHVSENPTVETGVKGVGLIQ